MLVLKLSGIQILFDPKVMKGQFDIENKIQQDSQDQKIVTRRY